MGVGPRAHTRDMAKHKLFCVPGTWEAVAAANGEHQGSFGLLGYSQGAAVVSLVGLNWCPGR